MTTTSLQGRLLAMHPISLPKSSSRTPPLLYRSHNTEEANTEHSPSTKNSRGQCDWTLQEIEDLHHYWKLQILTPQNIADFLEKTIEEVKSQSKTLNLPKKQSKPLIWGGIKWEFEEDSESDPKLLSPTTQRLVAEASATRFALIYQQLYTLKENSKRYKTLSKEMNQILKMQTRIFSKYISIKSRKFNFANSSNPTMALELTQAGQAAIFDCLRRWHPNRQIRYSRGAICIAITREMISWIEKQRLINLPDRIRTIARKLKRATDNGTLADEYHKLETESGSNCLQEAAKHQNTYAFISTLPLMDSFSEAEAERGGLPCFGTAGLGVFTTYHPPEPLHDLASLIREAIALLPPDEKTAVLLYHGDFLEGGSSDPKTLEEIGKLQGVTKERIRQRLTKAKTKLKRWFERKGIKHISDALTFA